MINTDILIVGSGPAGLSAAIYAGRGGRHATVIGGDVGGQASKAYEIENYPGFQKIKGFELMNGLIMQAMNFGVDIRYENAVSIDISNKEVTTDSGETYIGKTLILAMGEKHNDLSLEGEKELIGAGISYCATCDGNFYKKKKVAVVGGGDTAISDALFLSDIADEVTIIHRRNEFRATPSLVAKMRAKNIRILTPSAITKLIGNPLSALEITFSDTQKTEIIEINGLFIAVGTNPNTELVKDQLSMDGKYIKSVHTQVFGKDENIIEGVYAAGDIRKKTLRQIVTACSDGAVAATSALSFLNKIN